MHHTGIYPLAQILPEGLVLGIGRPIRRNIRQLDKTISPGIHDSRTYHAWAENRPFYSGIDALQFMLERLRKDDCVLPPLTAETAAAIIFRVSSSGTGSGFNLRMALVVWMISNRPVSSVTLSSSSGEAPNG